MPHVDSETRIFARFAAREPVVEVARLPHGGSYQMITDTLRELPDHCGVWQLDRVIEPERILARLGQRRLRCDAGPVRQDFAALQAAAAEPGVMFV